MIRNPSVHSVFLRSSRYMFSLDAFQIWKCGCYEFVEERGLVSTKNGTLLMNPSILTSNLQIDGFKHDFILMISSALSRRVGALQISIIIINA